MEISICCNRTKFHEEGSLFFWHSGLVLRDGQTSLTHGGIGMIHRNFIECTAEVGVWICHVEFSAINPSEVCVDWILCAIRSLVNEGCV